MNNNKNIAKYELTIKRLLSDHLGIDVDDLANDDHLKEDLHMNSVEISDFFHLLAENGIELDLTKVMEMQTVQDIIDISSENAEF